MKKVRISYKRVISCLLLVVFLGLQMPSSVFAADTVNNNQGIISGRCYKITSKQSKKVMEVSNAGKNNGDLIQQWDDVGVTNQEWIIEEVANGFYKITSLDSKKVIDIKDASSSNGATIHQWDFVNADNQLWYFEKTDDGFYQIKSKKNNKCLDIKGIVSTNGAKIQLWDDVNGDNQKWSIEEIVKKEAPIIAGASYKISNKNSKKSMEVAGSVTNNGGQVQQWDYLEGKNQEWTFEKVDNTYYKIIVNHTGKVLDVKDSNKNNGAIIHQWDYVGADNQLWYIEVCDDGYYQIKSKQSNKCLDIYGITTNNGARLQLWDDVNGDNQKWSIDKLEDKVLTGLSIEMKVNPDEDTDGDGIINSKELNYGTNMYTIDSDKDYLSDYEEVYTYNTDPNKSDTDNDGIDDYSEVKLGLNPIQINEVAQDYSLIVNNELLGVSIKVNGSAKAVSTTQVDKSEDEYLTSTADIVGNVLEFTSKDKISNANVTISYNYDEIQRKALDEDNLSIYYIDENELKLVKIDSIVDKLNKTINADLSHFSKYVIGDSSKINTNLKDLDIVFVIDQSGSMQWNDSTDIRIDVCSNLVNNINKDTYRFGIVPFTSSAKALEIGYYPSSNPTYLSGDKELVINKLQTLRNTADGGTNIANALKTASNLFDRDSKKIIVLLTDGDGSGDIAPVMSSIREKGIQVYTVGVGNAVNTSLLKNIIAQPTSGQYFHAQDVNNLTEIFKNIETKVTVPEIKNTYIGDTDGETVYKDLKVVADSGFRAEVDGYDLENFGSNYSEDGNCFGFAATSILYYYGQLPLNSEIMNYNQDFNYDLSKDDCFSNGKKIFSGVKLEKNIINNIRIVDIDNEEMLSSCSEKHQEVIKSIAWWQKAQNSANKESVIGNVAVLKSKLNKGPFEFSLLESDGRFGSKQGHAVVAQRLYQDTDDPSIYYLGIYDSNYPGGERFIEIEQSYVGIYSKTENLSYNAVNYEWDNFYRTIDVIGIKEDLEK